MVRHPMRTQPAAHEDATPPRTVLVTGGAGFVGSNLAIGLAQRRPGWSIVALDSLRRRGSELNLARLREADVRFVHGDVRVLDDVLGAGEFDAVVECSAEPSVLSGGDYVVQANLVGAYHCLELARRCDAQFVFLSTSRVYPVAELERLVYSEDELRFELEHDQPMPGASEAGIAEAFPLTGARTMYGATKLAAELLIEEYRADHGLRAVVEPLWRDRRPVAAGKGRPGRVHLLDARPPLRPTAELHRLRRCGQAGSRPAPRRRPARSARAPARALQCAGTASRSTSAAGGPAACRCSRRPRSASSSPAGASRSRRCRRTVRATSLSTSPTARRLFSLSDWRPKRGPRETLADIHSWIVEHEESVGAALAP